MTGCHCKQNTFMSLTWYEHHRYKPVQVLILTKCKCVSQMVEGSFENWIGNRSFDRKSDDTQLKIESHTPKRFDAIQISFIVRVWTSGEKIIWICPHDQYTPVARNCAIRSAQFSLEHDIFTILQVNLRLCVYLMCACSYATMHRA